MAHANAAKGRLVSAAASPLIWAQEPVVTQTSTKPSELVILLSLKNILWPLLTVSPILVLFFIKTFSIKTLTHNLDPAEIFFGAFIILCALFFLLDFIRGGKSRRYVVIGEKGIFVGGRKSRLIRWRQVKDCTCESSSSRLVMKIRTQRNLQDEAPSASFNSAHSFRAAKSSMADYADFNIDCARTETPQRSLDLAMQSCQAWLAAMRDSESLT